MYDRSRRATRSLPSITAGAIAILVAGIAVAARADGPQSVQQLVGAPGHTVWQITRPRVDGPRTDYPQITFKPGSTVTVTASGCVQTGGKGLSSKRYVDPVGDKSATLYHGEINIPGATRGLEFFKPAQPTVYTIPATATLGPTNFLQLGYTDTNYADDGYKSQDNGDQNQCRGSSDAVVVVDIAPIQAVGAAPATASYLFTIQNVTATHLRSLHNDTDVLAAAVVIDGTQSDIGTQTIGKLKNGSSASTNFSVLIDSVTPTDRIAISYVVANEGHPSSAKTDSILAGAVGKAGLTTSNTGSGLSAVAGFWTIAYDLLNPDCDGAVAAGAVTGTGTEFFGWAQSGTYQRTVSFPGTKSADGCGPDSLYEVTYSITPVSAQSVQQQQFSLKADIKAHVVTPGGNVRMIRKS